MKLLYGTERSPQNRFLGNLSFCIQTLFGIKTEPNKLLKEQEPGKPEYSKSGWRHVIYKLKLFLHRFFFKWRTIFNVSQFLLFPPLRTRHPIHIQLNPIYPSDHWSSRTRSIYQAPDFIHCSCWVRGSAKHKNHLNSNFMVVDRKSKCTDANFQVALFFVFLQMTKTNINNKENASPLTPWCEYLQNVEIHCKSALTLFRLRFCKAAIFMAWPQRRAGAETQKKSKIFSTW